MPTEKQSKFERRAGNLSLTLQKRDVDIIEAVFQYRFLKRDQIQRIINWPCLTRVNVRLRKLFDAGYLHRTFLPTTKGSSQAIYHIGKSALNILCGKTTLSIDELNKKIQNSIEVSPLFLNHAIMTSEARLRLTEALKAGSAQLNLWLNDLDCVDHFGYQTQKGRVIKRHFKPDGYCRFVFRNKIYSCFFEIDTGSMSHKRIVHKVHTYQEYHELGLYYQRFKLKNFRILFIVQTPERANTLKTALEARGYKNIWFIDIQNITNSSISEKIWLKSLEPVAIPFLYSDSEGGKQ